MDEAAQRRVDQTLARIAHVAASGSFQLLRAGAAHRRDDMRTQAERAAASTGRLDLVSEGRGAVRQILDERFRQFHPRIAYGWAADVTTAADRVEISLAFEDLVLAQAVADVVPEDVYRALAEEGGILLAEPRGQFDFEAVGLEEGGPVDPDVHRDAIARIGLIVVVVIAVFAVLIVFSQYGPSAAVLAAILAGSIVFTIAKPPPQSR